VTIGFVEPNSASSSSEETDIVATGSAEIGSMTDVDLVGSFILTLFFER
jgi:hypothetical protein